MKSFRIKNIKSFLDSGTVELAPITIFVGRNSCGKSSLLRFPVVLAQTVNSSIISPEHNPILFNGKYLDYGFFENVVHNQKGDTIEYEYSYDVDINDDQDYRYRYINDKKVGIEPHFEAVKMSFELIHIDKKISVKSVTMSVGKKKLITFGNESGIGYADLFYVVDSKDHFKKEYHRIEMDGLEFYDGGFPMYNNELELYVAIYSEVNHISIEKIDFKEVNSLMRKIEDTAHEYKFTEQEKKIKEIRRTFEKCSNIMTHAYVLFNSESVLMNYIGPFRDAPSRIYRDTESSSANLAVGARGENVSHILVRDFRKKRRLIKEISGWTKSTMGYEVSLDDLNNGFFQISLINKHGIHSDITDVGYGISQVLPIVTQVFRNLHEFNKKTDEEPIYPLYIEQPELHLHPAAQSDLADLFAKCIEGNERRSNIVIETHSEHLIRRLQVLISSPNSKLTRDMVKIYYVDKKENGNAYIKEMKMAENGKFETEWPSGFFDQAHKATMDLIKNTAEII